MFCERNDYSILESIINDLEKDKSFGMKTWSKHFKHENPNISNTFLEVLKQLGMEIY
jgi:hypothetical protein